MRQNLAIGGSFVAPPPLTAAAAALVTLQGVGVVNQSSYEWAVENLPLFESSDGDLNAAYYYRAKSYKSHMMRTDCEN